ncbi:hypothetical protein M9H77_22581 [Catharanthus roseus]|uniref:Uncharacterized protein n=1 Tax=Catharanthus roseus TaxID=4058 RepID=A0ACC0ATI1_CATRO|nr:hypothetical protein M9H77_22581 [Catharanthus roseus]
MEEQLIQTEQFRKSYVPSRNILRFFREQNMGCAVRRHINENVLAKLTELTKDEEEYLRKLDALKTKWKSKPDFLHHLFNNWLNPFAHKFVRYWIKSHMHFGVETTNQVESEQSVLKLWL